MRNQLLLIGSIVFMGCNNNHRLGAIQEQSIEKDAGPSFQPDTQIAQPSKEVGAQAVVPALDAMRAVGALGPTESWAGYIENYRFPSGSDTLKLSFAYDPAGSVVGSVVFGNALPPAPATDPNVGYPPGLDAQTLLNLPTEGFSYSMASGTFVANRLRVAINGYELWAAWCGMQPAPTDGSDMCLPNWGGGTTLDTCYQMSPTGDHVVVDCGKFILCFMDRICTCSSAGCAPSSGPQVTIDIFATHGTASGSVAGWFGEHNVHFVKDP